MRWIRLIGSFIGQVISWGCIIAYIFGIPSPFDVTDARSWIGAMMPTPVVIALCVAGIVVTGPLLWTSTWWWPRIAVATKSRQHGSPDLRAQPTSDGSVGEIDNDLERFRACLPYVQRCRKLISPFTGTLGTEVDPVSWLFRTFGEGNQKQPRTVRAPRADGYATHRCNTHWRSRSGLARPYPIRLINFTRHICPSHCPVLQGVVSASLIAS